MTPADDKRGPVGQAATLFELHYPQRLRALEYRAIWRRRGKTAHAANEPVPEPPNRIGLALSGGGIRSATFCLGVLQALAGRGLIGSLDYLSTVSGGGYIGSFLGRLFTRSWVKDREPSALADINSEEPTKPPADKNDRWLEPVADALEEPPGVRRVERVLDDHRSAPMQWLRESGRYLSPTGGADTLIDVAVALRNWAAVTVVMLVTLLSVFLLLGTVRAALWTREFWRINVEAPLILRTDHHWWWSPALIVPVVFFCLFTLPLGWAYWLTQRKSSTKTAPSHADDRETSPPNPILAVFVVILAGAAAAWILSAHGERMLASAAAVLAISGLCTAIWFWAFDCQKLNAEQVRNRLSRALAQSLLWTAALFVVTVVDSFGQMAWAMLRLENGPGLKSFLGVTGLIVVFSLAKRIKLLLDELPDRKATQIPLSVLAGIAAVVLGGGVLISLSAITHGLAWQWRNPVIELGADQVEKLCLTTNNPCCSNLMPLSPTNYFLPGTNLVAQWNGPKVRLNQDSLIKVTDSQSDGGCPCASMNWRWTLWPCIVCLLLTVLFGQTRTFLNLSSHSTLYAARLTRAYHGASNPDRWSGKNQRLSDCRPGDDIDWHDYKPHEFGGPLHVVNVTLNETVGGKSQVECRDRQGLIMALGPAGVSVGPRYHALWCDDGNGVDHVEPIRSSCDDAARDVRESKEQGGAVSTSEPIPFAELGYHPLPGRRPAADSERKTVAPQPVENLRLSKWIGISGAAFTTGLGSGTSLAKSLVTGMANVRLGYWWDSYVKATDRKAAAGENLVEGSRSHRWLGRLLPVQRHLFDEFLAQFHGPNERLWYLSDGGHFENTAAYELIRRRVPVIIICDCGADPMYQFQDLAALTRLTRVDFGAEIEFLSGADAQRLTGAEPGLFGEPKDFESIARRAKKEASGENLGPSEAAASTSRNGPHALLAAVHYPLPDGTVSKVPGSYLIVIKPSVSGDEPIDLWNYRLASPRFPQEPTSDQYFDEAQWESYRKLGRHIGEELFPERDEARETDPPWFTKLFQAAKS